MERPPGREHLSSLCSLDDPTRAALYDYVAERGRPVSREEAGAAVGVDRSVAAYHLDRLVEEGLLTASFARPAGRGGPGAGRPAKLYEPTTADLEASVPPRDYRLAAELLARALEAAARQVGEELATTSRQPTDLWTVLERLGYRPYRDGAVVRLRNCPFRRIAEKHTEVVCGMNLALMSGVAAVAGEAAQVRLDPAPDRCCVAFRAGPELRRGVA